MSRYFVPIVAAMAVILIPATLIGAMVRSPYTHANLEPRFDPSYERTQMTELGAPVLLRGVAMAVELEATTPLAERGKAILAIQGCEGCHGLNGKGGVVAPAIVPDIEIIRAMVRRGPGGMPVFSSQGLTDYDITAIAVFLQSQAGKN